jgi:DNA-3-methyladenine glycosylase I
VVSRFGDADVERLLGDAGIVRHRGKIASTINNAQRALELIDEFGSIATFLDRFVPAPQPAPTGLGQIPAKTAESTAISKELKRRGWSFVGPTTVYAFMQSMGLVNDHLAGCEFR